MYFIDEASSWFWVIKNINYVLQVFFTIDFIGRVVAWPKLR